MVTKKCLRSQEYVNQMFLKNKGLVVVFPQVHVSNSKPSFILFNLEVSLKNESIALQCSYLSYVSQRESWISSCRLYI